jgi:hypothetical protein
MIEAKGFWKPKPVFFGINPLRSKGNTVRNLIGFQVFWKNYFIFSKAPTKENAVDSCQQNRGMGTDKSVWIPA